MWQLLLLLFWRMPFSKKRTTGTNQKNKIATQSDVRVAGISIDDRQENFLKVMNAQGFRLSLEPEPDNPVNPKARKVLAHGKVNGQMVAYHIGYLSDEIANHFAGAELDIRPKAVLLPDERFENLSIELTLLERSAAYLKKQGKLETAK